MKFQKLLKSALLVIGLQLALVPGASALERSCANIFQVSARENPLVTSSGLPYEALAFDKIKINDFMPAIEQTIAIREKNFAELAHDPAPPTIENTVERLESMDAQMERLISAFSLYRSTKSNAEVEKINELMTKRLSDLGDDRDLALLVLKRLETLSARRETLGLTIEQKRLLARKKNLFTNESKLRTDADERFDKVNERLATLSAQFKKNVMSVETETRIDTSDPHDIEGIPDDVIEIARLRAAKEGRPAKWSFVSLDVRPSILPNSKSKTFRERAWRIRSRTATPTTGFDNRETLLEIAKLREERAKIRGYENYAASILPARMAGNVETVTTFLNKLADKYIPAAKTELKELEAFAGHAIEPWDVEYYIGKLQAKRFGFEDEQLRPYFPIDQVMKGFFYTANRLYGVTFRPRTDLPNWDPSVQVFQVLSAEGAHLGLYYIDPFSRLGEKKSGAWNMGIQKGGLVYGKSQRPFVVNVENFPAPLEGQPALLTPDNVVTLFHEGGHALHDLLSRTRYREFSGTSVAWDFVELPSQFMENYAFQPEVLANYARHFKTGEKLPDVIAEQIRASQTFMSGIRGAGQVRSALLDMAWHTRDLSGFNTKDDVDKFEEEVLANLRTVRQHDELISTSFQHVFSGGYAAGYYGYKWADVLAADAFETFLAEGIFNPATAERFKTSILERGGSRNAANLYRKFRGSDPDPEALLRSEGLLPAKPRSSAQKTALRKAS
jgi:peptidyl-dipeptidase Dcp